MRTGKYLHFLLHGLANTKFSTDVSISDLLLGPNELAVYHPQAQQAFDGRYSQCEKSDWYDLVLPNQSFEFTRDRKAHETRRQVWLHGLNTKGKDTLIKMAQ